MTSVSVRKILLDHIAQNQVRPYQTRDLPLCKHFQDAILGKLASSYYVDRTPAKMSTTDGIHLVDTEPQVLEEGNRFLVKSMSHTYHTGMRPHNWSKLIFEKNITVKRLQKYNLAAFGFLTVSSINQSLFGLLI